ncbi:prephenate dehydrogenase/arogenate dehydrogenase family protein [Microaceticoccus formicicus]|uniref:prephenate dehydrogenase/arogenate dehydrogenase family protein n=1 Tax=Microaceticoccus formicicus TaxID=3118105 RepID=UPI003CD0175E|nr:prephenate dehydrogenase/arogenate dehydrogenase family protein [Peptoniphilaceae bacterium AMB_02]
MEIGVIGLGKMGYGLACNLKDNGYTVYGYDINSSEVAKAADYGIGAYSELSEFLKSFENKKIIFLMTPSGIIVDETIEKILPELNKEDIIIDAGNSNFNDSIRRYKSLKEKGIDFLDCGTSGGPRGARHGACTMIGGDFEVYKMLETVFEKISVEGGSLYTGGSRKWTLCKDDSQWY